MFGCFGFLMAIMVLPAFVTPSDEIPSMELVSEKIANGANIEELSLAGKETNNEFIERMRDIMFDLVEFGCIEGFLELL